MNSVFIAGRLGADPEKRNASSGLAIVRLRVATSESVKKGDQWEDHTEWHSVTVFGRRGEYLAEKLSKGSFVVVAGKLRTSSYEKDGDKRYKTEIIADKVDFDHKAQSGSGAAPAFDQPANAGSADDDIPF